MAEVDGFAEPIKDNLLALIEQGWTDWQALLAHADGRLEEPDACGTWSVKDVIAHVTAYQRFAASLIGGDVRKVDVPQDIGLDFQRRNEFFHEQDRHRSLDDVLAESHHVHHQIVARVQAMSPDDLRAQPVGWFHWPAWRWLIHLTHEHYPEHVPGLHSWLGLDEETR